MTSLVKARLPFFLGPEDHGLALHYRTLNRVGIWLLVIVLVLNETILRPKLTVYRAAQQLSVEAILAFVLNAELPPALAVPFVLFGAIPFTVVLAITLFALPKWGQRAAKAGLQSGLPASIADYRAAHFYFDRTYQQLAFWVWHHVLMRVAFLMGVLTPCMLINLLRDL